MGATHQKSVAFKLEQQIAAERELRSKRLNVALAAFAESFDREMDLRLRHAAALSAIPQDALKSEDLSASDRARLELRHGPADESAPQAILRMITTAGPQGLFGGELNRLARAAGFTIGTIERAKQRLKFSKAVSRNSTGAWVATSPQG